MKLLITLLLLASVWLGSVTPTFAQAQTESVTGEVILEATDSADATMSAETATPAATTEQKIQEKKDQDITETGGKQKSRLEQFLDDNPPEPLGWNNFIQHAIRYSVTEGVPVNTLVLVLLFPLVASLIATSRHIIGLRGFGVYIPAVLSVALISTGIIEGIIIFLTIVITASVAKRVIIPLKLSYLPRTALLLWMISLGILVTLFISPSIDMVTLMTVNIFPILILVLLAENFLDAQSRTKQQEAIALTVETIVLSVVGGLILKWESMQQLALLEPELLIVGILGLNVIIGKFSGLRLSERLRFRSIMEEEE
ncbi:MAG: transglut protein [Patescibacteria group bacterium]|nr:transglut protein [Patescibacteria group bacterium]